jgi:AraC-like DNA-binding protein
MAAPRLSTWGPAHGRAAITPLFEGSVVALGAFACDPADPLWERENCIGEGAHVVFPSTSVRIALDGRPPALTNANHVVVYRPQRRFRRELCDRRGDRSLFAVLDPAVLDELLGGADPPEGVGRLDPAGFLALRTLAGAPPADPLEAEERLLALVRLSLPAVPARLRRPGSHRAVEAAKELLAARLDEPLTLAAIGRAVHVSPYHLARTFRRHTGYSLHEYRTQLRLRTVAARLGERDRRLAELAVEAGFASHSHLTDAFRRGFGVAPSALRKRTITEAEHARRP